MLFMCNYSPFWLDSGVKIETENERTIRANQHFHFSLKTVTFHIHFDLKLPLNAGIKKRMSTRVNEPDRLQQFKNCATKILSKLKSI